jgi:hypothetical protein
MTIGKRAAGGPWSGPLMTAVCGSLLFWAGAISAAGQGQQTGQEQYPDRPTQTQGSGGQAQQGQAQQSQAQQSQAQQGPAQSLPEAYKLSNWIGKPVRSTAGDELGKVADLVMDDYGVVRYVILERNSQEQAGQDRVAVPLGHFLYPLGQEQQAALVLDVTPEQMAQAPGFASSAWPNMGDEQWNTLVIAYWLPESASQQQRQQAQSGQAGDVPFDAKRDMVYLPDEKEQLFSQLDENSDAAIEREEAQSNERLADQFDRLDTYSNGRLTRSEFAMFEVVEGSHSSPEPRQQGRPAQQQSPGMQQQSPAGGIEPPQTEGQQQP